MARSDYRFADSRRPHFLTSTVVAWLPIVTRPAAVEIVLDSWRFSQRTGRITLFGCVILENHLHWIAAADDLSKEVGNFKSFTAKQLLRLLESAGADTLLEQLEYYKLRHKLDQRYQLWQEGAIRKRSRITT